MNLQYPLSKIIIVLSIIVTMLGCDDDNFDTPPVSSLDESSILTVSQLKLLIQQEEEHVFTGDSSLFAVVVMDESSGNIYKELYVEDSTGAIHLGLNAPSRFNEGDLLRINLNETTLRYYRELLEVGDIEPSNLVFQSENHEVEPTLVTISDLLEDSNYQSKLVKIQDVQFVSDDLNEPYADLEGEQGGNRILTDAQGNSIIVRTSLYADFAADTLPSGSGTFVGVVSQFYDDMQLIIRRTSEVNLDEERF